MKLKREAHKAETSSLSGFPLHSVCCVSAVSFLNVNKNANLISSPIQSSVIFVYNVRVILGCCEGNTLKKKKR